MFFPSSPAFTGAAARRFAPNRLRTQLPKLKTPRRPERLRAI